MYRDFTSFFPIRNRKKEEEEECDLVATAYRHEITDEERVATALKASIGNHDRWQWVEGKGRLGVARRQLE